MNYKDFRSAIRNTSEFRLATVVATCVVILVLSTMGAMWIGSHFPGDPLPRYVIFFSSIILMGLLFRLFYRLSEPIATIVIGLINFIRRKRGKQSLSYQARCDEAEEEKRKQREHLKSTISAYVRHEITPFLPENEVTILKEEILKWIENAEYRPDYIQWHWKHGVHNIDMRHFIWNIAIRLDSKEGHSMTCACEFVSHLFEDLFHDIKFETIRNLTISEKDSHYIMLDRPDKGSIKFHYKRETA